jgi:hypothetical protein
MGTGLRHDDVSQDIFFENKFYDDFDSLTDKPEPSMSVASESTVPSSQMSCASAYYNMLSFSSNSMESQSPFSPGSCDDPSRRRPRKKPMQDSEKERYVVCIDSIKAGSDARTTVMIKNIPNKYTQKMLLNAINRNHRGSFDFFYLPIDFKNKCNVGYAFINFRDAGSIPKFYREFHQKHW